MGCGASAKDRPDQKYTDTQGSADTAESDTEIVCEALPLGTEVEAHSLHAADLNGERGTVCGTQGGRLQVRFACRDQAVALKPENLRVIQPASPSAFSNAHTVNSVLSPSATKSSNGHGFSESRSPTSSPRPAHSLKNLANAHSRSPPRQKNPDGNRLESRQRLGSPDICVTNGFGVDLPDRLSQHLSYASRLLAEGKCVIPCEQARCRNLHGNVTKIERGFCSKECYNIWYANGIQQIRDVGGDILGHWNKLDADFTMQYYNKADAKFPDHAQLRPAIKAAMQHQEREYRMIAEALPQKDQFLLKQFEATGELWPSTLPLATLKERAVQCPEAKSMPETYALGLRRYRQLYAMSVCLARSVGSSRDVLYSVKRPMRIFKKTHEDYPEEFWQNDFRHCADIYRTSVVLDTLAQVSELIEMLKRFGRGSGEAAKGLQMLRITDGSTYIVERIKNRFAKPCAGGYMDVLVSLRIDGYVCEMQLHLQAMLDLKKDGGHKTFKWARRFLHDEETYEGHFLHGMRHGFGTLIFVHGYRYEGEFENGKRQGKGTFHYTDGSKYEGQFRDNKLHGKGIFFYIDGSRYDGSYEQGMKHGKGTWYFSDGPVEVRCYERNVVIGQGVRWSADRREAWETTEGKIKRQIDIQDAAVLHAQLGFPGRPP